MARPTKLTPDRQKRICDNVRLGLSYERAALAAGITEQTLLNWRQRAEAERERLTQKGTRKRKREAPYVEFLGELELSEAQAEQLLIAKIQKAATDGKWTAAAWILERRHPERWARLEKRELKVEGLTIKGYAVAAASPDAWPGPEHQGNESAD